MESQACKYCEGKLRGKKSKLSYAKAVEEHQKLIKEIQEMKDLPESKDQEIGELKKLNIDLNIKY